MGNIFEISRRNKRYDISGEIFQKLTVITRAGIDDWEAAYWLCQCSCGRFCIRGIKSLTHNKSDNMCEFCRYPESVHNSSIEIDKTYGKLTPIEIVKVMFRDYRWKFKCTCGNLVEIKESDILNNSRTECYTCTPKNDIESRSGLHLDGQRFGKLLVTGLNGSRNNETLWNCKCDCGKTAIAVGWELRSGNTTSCGCYKGGNGNKGVYKTRQGKLETYHSLWELLMMLILDSKKYSWTKNHNVVIPYEYQNKIHHHYPDFYVSDFKNCIIEVKGRLINQEKDGLKLVEAKKFCKLNGLHYIIFDQHKFDEYVKKIFGIKMVSCILHIKKSKYFKNEIKDFRLYRDI